MGYKTLNILEFQSKFNCQEACLKEIEETRWPEGFVCPHCSNSGGTRLSSRRAIQCKGCQKQVSITAGTLFHKTRVPLVNWFWLIYLMSQDKGGISTKRASEVLGMHYTTVWGMMHKIREAMKNRMEGRMLAGYVEVDDAFFGGKSKRKKPMEAASATRRECA